MKAILALHFGALNVSSLSCLVDGTGVVGFGRGVGCGFIGVHAVRRNVERIKIDATRIRGRCVIG